MKALLAALLLVGVSFAAQAGDIYDEGGEPAAKFFREVKNMPRSNASAATSGADHAYDVQQRECLEGSKAAYCSPEALPGKRYVDPRSSDPTWQTVRACGVMFASKKAAAYSCPHTADIRYVRGVGILCDCNQYND